MASIRQVIPAVLSIQLTLAVGLTGLFSFWNGQRAVFKLAGQQLREINDRIEQHVEAYLQIPKLVGESVSLGLQSGLVDPDNQEELQPYLWRKLQEFQINTHVYYGNENGDFLGIDKEDPQDVVERVKPPNSPTVRYIYRLTADGQRIVPARETQVYDPRTRAWYKQAKAQRRSLWSPVFVSADRKWLSTAFAVPIWRPDNPNTLRGVVGVNVTLTQISDFLRQQTQGKGFQAFVVDRAGNLVATSTDELPFVWRDGDPQRLSASNSADPVLRSVAQNVNEKLNGFDQIVPNAEANQFKIMVDGQPFLSNVEPMESTNGLPWITIVTLPESAFMTEIENNNRTTLAIILTTLVLNLFIGLLVARWLLRPIDKLNQAAESIQRGVFDDTVLQDLTHRQDEMGQMARVFQRMGSTVAARELELKERMTLLQAETDRAKQAAAAAKLGQGIDVQGLLNRARQLRSTASYGQVNLRQISYLKTMAQSDLERLLTLGKQRSLKAGEFACREDELGSEFFIILSGEVVVLARGQEVNRLYQGDYFGEVALLLNIPRIASVQAVTDTQLLVLDRKGLQTLLQDFPELSDRIFLSLSDRRAELQKRQQLLEQVGVDTQSNGGYLNWVKQKLHALRQLFPAQVN